jgi:tetratricopeptide (TPR) repeat protein
MTWDESPPDPRAAAVAAALDSARDDLAAGRSEQAKETLARAARRQRGVARAPLYLYLAACYALEGDDGLGPGDRALRSAIEADRTVAADPLARVLAVAFDARRGAASSAVKRALRSIPAPLTGEATFHAAATMLLVGDAKGALRRLISLEAIPDHLRWRRWSLLGQAHEQSGDLNAAIDAYKAAIDVAPDPDKAGERLALAACLLDVGKPHEVLGVTAAISPDLLDPSDQAELHSLAGRAQLDLDNPNKALELLALARGLGDGGGFETAFGYAQALAALHRFDAAAEALDDTLALASSEQRPYVLHELAWVLQERGDDARAAAILEAVVADEGYPTRALAISELADLYLRTGDLERARITAERALEAGAVAQACLVLGALALEYYHLDEAVRCYEQALAASTPPDPNWVAAHQLLADVHAQRGEAAADRALRHALTALEYTDPTSEWRLPLEAHVAWARAILGGHDRLLN